MHRLEPRDHNTFLHQQKSAPKLGNSMFLMFLVLEKMFHQNPKSMGFNLKTHTKSSQSHHMFKLTRPSLLNSPLQIPVHQTSNASTPGPGTCPYTRAKRSGHPTSGHFLRRLSGHQGTHTRTMGPWYTYIEKTINLWQM